MNTDEILLLFSTLNAQPQRVTRLVCTNRSYPCSRNRHLTSPFHTGSASMQGQYTQTTEPTPLLNAQILQDLSQYVQGYLLDSTDFVPESARWLISKKKFDRASKIICRAAKANKKDGKLPENFMEEIKKTEEMHTHEGSATRTATFIDLFRTPNLRKSTLNFMYNWFINSLVYYGLSLSTSDLGSNVYIAFFISGAVEIPAYFIGVPMMESCLGRRYSTSICELLGGIACLLTILLPLGTWKTVIAMIGKFGISASFSLVYIYAAEVIPTPLRSVGVGMCSTAARVGGILSPLILLLDEVWKPLPLIIFGSSAIIGGVLVLLLPESRGKMLPETIEEGEIFSMRSKKSRMSAYSGIKSDVI